MSTKVMPMKSETISDLPSECELRREAAFPEWRRLRAFPQRAVSGTRLELIETTVEALVDRMLALVDRVLALEAKSKLTRVNKREASVSTR